MTDVCHYSESFVTKGLNFILTNKQITEKQSQNHEAFKNLLENQDNNSYILLDEYVGSLTEKLKELQKSKHLFICDISNILWIYLPPIIFILGSLGNVLSFVILRHPSTGSVTTFVYLIARSIVDEMVLIVGLLRRWIDKLIDSELANTSNFICKMVHFWGTSSSLLSVWLTVTLTAERALVVSFPLHVSRVISYSRVRNVIIIMSIICIALSSHFFFTAGIISNCTLDYPPTLSSTWNRRNQMTYSNETSSLHFFNSQNKCLNHCAFLPNYEAMNWYWSTFDAIAYSYLPFCLIFGFNFVILKSVYRASKERSILHGHKCRHKYMNRHNPSPTGSVTASTSFSARKRTQTNEPNYNVRQLTIVLLIISFAFLFTTVSIVLIKILAQILDLRGTSKRIERTYMLLADTIAELFMYINHAMNFYLFCATGKTFRKRLVLLFSRRRQTKMKRIDKTRNNNNHFICAFSSCLSVPGERFYSNETNYRKSHKNQTGVIHLENRSNQNCPENLLTPSGTKIYNTLELIKVPVNENKSTTWERLSFKFCTSLRNNSSNTSLQKNYNDIEKYNLTRMPKSKSSISTVNNNELSPNNIYRVSIEKHNCKHQNNDDKHQRHYRSEEYTPEKLGKQTELILSSEECLNTV
uniref:G-protein coupled receptors family 1 profile domain-containing protein n=1 Tax=Trichobilharzia regenti TaxID=157069 RepID=A0AA85JHC9_TRIRE|nr:unnamed protein product [Trichobilharzia regenti]